MSGAPSAPGRKLGGISAVLPAMNDGGTIASMVLAARAALRRTASDYEIIVVDNGSRDYSGAVLAELASLLPELRVLSHEESLGYGGALRAGFSAASKEWIFYTDSDAQYDPLELGRLAEAAEGVDAVNGYKIARQDPWYRTLLGRTYHHTARLLFGFRLRDVDCDFRLFRRALLAAVPLESTTGTIGLELVKRFQDAGYRFAEVPVSHYYRRFGDSQFFRPARLWRTAKAFAALWVRLVLRKGRR
ncbi:MAG: glycosyltransferase family 2 protein [Anaerolineales bacterium]|nr:glycosyltransferase family 2 protein [Anaerolineales bacterium]